MTDRLRTRLAAAEKQAAAAEGGGLPSFESVETLEALLRELGRTAGPEALALEELHRGGELRAAWLASGHRWPVALLTADDWKL